MNDKQIKEAMRLNKGLKSLRILYLCLAGIPLWLGIILSIFSEEKGVMAGTGYMLLLIGGFMAVLGLIFYPICYFGIRQQVIDGKIDKYGNRLTANKPQTIQAKQARQQRAAVQQQVRQPSTNSAKSTTTNTKCHSTESTGVNLDDVLDNPLTKFATAYAVGKASQEVTKAMGIRIPEGNSEKYKHTVSVTGNSAGSRSMNKYQFTEDGQMYQSNTRKVAPNYEITTLSNGSERLVNTKTHKQIGHYDKMHNTTYENYKAIGKGNLLMSLIK